MQQKQEHGKMINKRGRGERELKDNDSRVQKPQVTLSQLSIYALCYTTAKLQNLLELVRHTIPCSLYSGLSRSHVYILTGSHKQHLTDALCILITASLKSLV